MGSVTGSWPDLLGHLVAGRDLGAEDTEWAMNLVMTGEATPARIAAFVVALRAKGETPAEIRGMASAMLAHARPLEITRHAVDVVGTGGDHSGSVNISTMAALVVAATGTTVVKHGNRAASSSSGAADVLEALGVAVDLPPEGVRACVAELGIGFCFAPVFHPAYRHASGPRREIGIPTAFNALGPLTNPGLPTAGLVGCADRRIAPVIATVLADRGSSALVVHGDDGMDEITTTTSTTAWVAREGAVHQERIDPTSLGIPVSTAHDLRGGDATDNAQVVRDLLAGKSGPVRDTVLINAAGAIVAFERDTEDLAARLRPAIDRAAHAIDSGAAADLLERWITRSTELRSTPH